MSRIGNKPITVPAGVEVTLDGNHITVKGPKGTMEKDLHKNMEVSIEGNVITVKRPDDEALNRSLHGLTRTLINNMIEGVLNQYARTLEVNGVGYRAQLKGKKLDDINNYGLVSEKIKNRVNGGATSCLMSKAMLTTLISSL